MRISVIGNSNIAVTLRGNLGQAGYALGDKDPNFSIILEPYEGNEIELDVADCKFARILIAQVGNLEDRIAVKIKDGNLNDKSAMIRFPGDLNSSKAIELGVVRALDLTIKYTNITNYAVSESENVKALHTKLDKVLNKKPWWKFFVAALFFAGTANAQIIIPPAGGGGSGGSVTQGTIPWDVSCSAGCSGGTTDTDDGSIAAGQVTGINLGLTNVFDGTVWRRLTIGTAGTASSQVLTVQGIAAMTPILSTVTGTVTANAGTNLNTSLLATESTLSTLNGKVTAVNTGAVTISAALPAGTNAIGKLSANSGVDIGDVDVTSIAAGNNNIGDVDVASLPAIPTGTNSIGTVVVNPCAGVNVTSVPFTTATSGNSQLVAISGSTVVYACGYNFISRGTVEVQFITGTGSACATGETDKTGPYSVLVGAGIAVASGGGIQFKGAAGEAMCIELSANVEVDGILTYVQQ